MTVQERRALYLAQIIRDTKVLAEDPIYSVPTVQFYLDRIQAFRDAIQEMDDDA